MKRYKILILNTALLFNNFTAANQPYGDTTSLQDFFIPTKYFPSVFGSDHYRPKVNLYDLYNLNQEEYLYKTFPIELKCIYAANCYVYIQAGEHHGDFIIKGFVKRNYGQRRVFNILIKMFKSNEKINLNNNSIAFHQQNELQVINNTHGASASPLLIIDYNKPIAFFNFPIQKNLYFQVCNLDYNYCYTKKQIFDQYFSNNFIHYLKFWKLNEYRQLGPNASVSYTKTYQKSKTIVDAKTYEYTIAGKIGYKKNTKIGENVSDYSAEASLQFKYGFTTAISKLTSESSSYTVNFTSKNNKSMAGAEYILYKGVFLDYPLLDSFINDLNLVINYKDEFKFTRLNSFKDENTNSLYKGKYITSGSADLEKDPQNENNDKFRVTNWTPTVLYER